jgi:hypothetical protein
MGRARVLSHEWTRVFVRACVQAQKASGGVQLRGKLSRWECRTSLRPSCSRQFKGRTNVGAFVNKAREGLVGKFLTMRQTLVCFLLSTLRSEKKISTQLVTSVVITSASNSAGMNDELGNVYVAQFQLRLPQVLLLVCAKYSLWNCSWCLFGFYNLDGGWMSCI